MPETHDLNNQSFQVMLELANEVNKTLVHLLQSCHYEDIHHECFDSWFLKRFNYKRKADQIDLLIKKHFKYRKDIVILDIGCGTGNLAIELYKRGYKVICVDKDSQMIERAKQKEPQMTFIIQDAKELDIDINVDVALAVNVFLSKKELNGLFAALKKILRKGGIIHIDSLVGNPPLGAFSLYFHHFVCNDRKVLKLSLLRTLVSNDERILKETYIYFKDNSFHERGIGCQLVEGNLYYFTSIEELLGIIPNFIKITDIVKYNRIIPPGLRPIALIGTKIF